MKNIVITGTSRGIGFELAKKFAENGHQVLALSRNKKPLSDFNHKNITVISVDLSKNSDFIKVTDFAIKTIKKHAGKSVNEAKLTKRDVAIADKVTSKTIKSFQSVVLDKKKDALIVNYTIIMFMYDNLCDLQK